VRIDFTLANLCIDYVTASTERRNSPGSDDFANFEEFQRREIPLMLEQHLQELVDREHESIEEGFKSDLLALLRNCSAEVVQRYLRMRRSTAVNPTAAENESVAASDTLQEGAPSEEIGGPYTEDRLETIFHQPPPPPDFVSQDDYPAPGFRRASINELNLQSLTSSRNSASNQFSTTSLMLSRRAPKSSRTSLSESLVSYDAQVRSHTYISQHHTHRHNSTHPISSVDLSNRTSRVFTESESHRIENSFHGNEPQAGMPAFNFSNESRGHTGTSDPYLPTQNTGPLPAAPYEPSTSTYQTNIFLDEQSSRLSELPTTGPTVWSYPTAQFNDAQFHPTDMFGSHFIPSTPQPTLTWDSGLPTSESRNEHRFVEGNFNNEVELDLEFSQSRPKRRRR
jgi:hypothetical protein